MTDSATAPVFEFDIPVERKEQVPTLTFAISGEQFVMRRPKLSIAVGLVSLLDDNGIAGLDAATAGVKVAEVIWGMVAYVEQQDPEPWVIHEAAWTPRADQTEDDRPLVTNPNAGRLRGQARLVQRLRDPQDAMDVIDLAPLFERVSTKLFDRPTGPSLA